MKVFLFWEDFYIMDKKFRFFSNILIIIAAAMWGIDGVLLTPSYFSRFHFYNVEFIVFVAHFIPFIFLSIFMFKKYKYLKEFTLSDLTYFFLIALFGGVIGTLSMVKALQLSEFSQYSVVILLQKLQPVFAILLAAILLKEKPGKKFYLLALVAVGVERDFLCLIGCLLRGVSGSLARTSCHRHNAASHQSDCIFALVHICLKICRMQN